MIRVLVVVQRRILRESLAHVLGERDEISVVGAVGHSALALAMVQDLEPEVVLVDAELSDCDELVSSIVASSERTNVVALGECSDSAVSTLPDASLTEVVAAIHGAAHSKVIRLPIVPDNVDCFAENSCLTPREREIVALIDKGYSNKEIARELNMAVSTVKNHVHHILGKLEVDRRGQAAAALRVRPPTLYRVRN